jgi:hypothetical protein
MPVVVRRERRKKVCARVALDTLLGGRSSAALDTHEEPPYFASMVGLRGVMQYRVTPMRILCGLGLSLIFAFQSYGHVALRQWSLARGFLFGLIACAAAFGLAFTARLGADSGSKEPDQSAAVIADDDTPARKIRNHIAVWVVTVLLFLFLFKVMDAFHVNWRQYIH